MAGGIVVDPDTPVVNINTNNDNTNNVESDFGGEFVPGGGEEEGTGFGARTGGESDFGAEFVPGGGEEGIVFSGDGLTSDSRVETGSEFGNEFIPNGGGDEGTITSDDSTTSESLFGSEFIPNGGEEEGAFIASPNNRRVDNVNGQEDDGGRVEKRQGQNDPVIVVVTATATDKVTATAATDVTATATVRARFRGVRDYVL